MTSSYRFKSSGRNERSLLWQSVCDRIWHHHHYPWTVVRLLPNAQHYTIARFYNRTEAENHKRFLGKWMPAAEFEVIFDQATVTTDH